VTIRPGFSGTVPIFNDVSRKKSLSSRDADLYRYWLGARISPDTDKLHYFTVRILMLTCWSLIYISV